MIVAYSRPIAMKIYDRILELRPNWTEKVAVVMTSGNNDPEEWRKIIGNKSYKEELARKFKDNSSPLKIAIVVDMWLTGFDVPSLATMYVYKPMSGHNLMEAIARVNRVYGDKEGGLVVDYIGIAAALKQAMNDYTKRDKKNYGDPDIGKVAYPKFLEFLSICRDLFHGYDYSRFVTGTDLDRARMISGGVNFIIARGKEEDKETFEKQALMLHQSLSLCSSLVEEELRLEAAFFESVRVLVLRLASKGGGNKISLPEMNRRVNELLNNTTSVRSGACAYCSSYNSGVYVPSCRRGYSIDNRSYIEFECDKAVEAGIKIVVLYNSSRVDRYKCPEAVRFKGKHVAMHNNGYWDYQAVKNAIMY